MLISRPPFLCLLVRVCLPDFVRSPVGRILSACSGRRCITLQRSSRGDGLRRGPLRCLIRVPSHQEDSRRCRPDLSVLKSDRLPTYRAVHCRQSFAKQRSFGLVPLDVPIFYFVMTDRAFFVWGHRHGRLRHSLHHAPILHDHTFDATLAESYRRAGAHSSRTIAAFSPT
jgi:hypothetical protein